MNQLLSTFFIVTYKGGGVTRNAEIISSPSPIILLILTFPYLQKLIITEIIIGKKASITVPTHQSINSTLSSAVCLIMSSVVICTDSSCSTTNTSPPLICVYILFYNPKYQMSICTSCLSVLFHINWRIMSSQPPSLLCVHTTRNRNPGCLISCSEADGVRMGF